MYTQCQETNIIVSKATDVCTAEHWLYEPELTREEVAKELSICSRTVLRYIDFGSQFIPELKEYVNESGELIRKRFKSSHLVYLQEIADLKRRFSNDRVNQILNRKYKGV